MPKTIIVIPTYNERENLPKLITELFALPIDDLEVLIVDDNSPDGTGQIVDALAAEDLRIHALHRAGKLGLGTAYVQGFGEAIRLGAEQIMQMDADFSHQPKYIADLLGALDGCDVVVGSRWMKGGSVDERWSFWRKLLSVWANVIWVKAILNTPIRDATGGYRAWKRATLQGMGLDRVRSNGYVFQVEMTYIAARLGYTFREVPIHFPDRRFGQSKMGLRITVEAALRCFQVRWRHRGLNPSMRIPIPE